MSSLAGVPGSQTMNEQSVESRGKRMCLYYSRTDPGQAVEESWDTGISIRNHIPRFEIVKWAYFTNAWFFHTLCAISDSLGAVEKRRRAVQIRRR